MRWAVVAGYRGLGCSRRSSHSCRQVVVEVEVVGLYSPGYNLLGCRVAGCNSAGKQRKRLKFTAGIDKGLL